MDTRQIAWLAGYLDGEGCFTYTACKYKYPRLIVESTDQDIIQRVALMFGVRACGPKSHGPHQLTWYTACVGSRAIGWMQTLYPYLSKRRQTRIREILQSVREKYNADLLQSDS